MKQTKYLYKIAQTPGDLQRILNTDNTDKLMANIIEFTDITSFYLIVWED